MGVKFSDLGASPQICHELKRAGFEEPFEVQRETIPDMILGRDICCRAPTGSGKTLAFGIPILERTPRSEPRRPKALILTPTRELAEQIYHVLDPIAWGIDLRVMSIYGGVSYGKQIKRLEKGVDIVVACPGRLLDLLERRSLYLDDVEIVVLDEADRMADMGFTEPVSQILDECTPNRQTIMFSATLDDEVAELREQYQNDPAIIEVGPKEVSVDQMSHHFWLMKNSMKSRVAAEAIRKSGRGFIFCRTRAGVDRVSEEVEDEGLRVTSIHGGMQQNKRERALSEFLGGNTHAIVATDVAARGLDIPGIHCVIHFDPPENGKAFKHRSGRTARAGGSGNVISFVQNPQKGKWSKIQREVGLNVKFGPPEFNDLKQHEEISYIAPPPKNRSSSRDRRDRRGRPNSGNDRNSRRGGHYGNRNRGGGGGRGGGGNRGGGGGRRDGGNRGGGNRGGGGRGGGGGRRDGGNRGGGNRGGGGGNRGGGNRGRGRGGGGQGRSRSANRGGRNN